MGGILGSSQRKNRSGDRCGLEEWKTWNGTKREIWGKVFAGDGYLPLLRLALRGIPRCVPGKISELVKLGVRGDGPEFLRGTIAHDVA